MKYKIGIPTTIIIFLILASVVLVTQTDVFAQRGCLDTERWSSSCRNCIPNRVPVGVCEPPTGKTYDACGRCNCPGGTEFCDVSNSCVPVVGCPEGTIFRACTGCTTDHVLIGPNEVGEQTGYLTVTGNADPDPVTVPEGSVYYNTGDNGLRVRTDTGWEEVGGANYTTDPGSNIDAAQLTINKLAVVSEPNFVQLSVGGTYINPDSSGNCPEVSGVKSYHIDIDLNGTIGMNECFLLAIPASPSVLMPRTVVGGVFHAAGNAVVEENLGIRGQSIFMDDVTLLRRERGPVLLTLNQDDPVREYSGLRLDRQGDEKWFIGMNTLNDRLIVRQDSSSDRIVIDEIGRVGIGGTTMTAKLNIVDNTGGAESWKNSGILIYNANTSNHGEAAIAYRTKANGTGSYWFTGINQNVGEGGYSIAYGQEFTSSNTHIMIEEAGKVGINKIDPAYDLDVGGTIRSSDVRVTDDLFVSDVVEFDNDGNSVYNWSGGVLKLGRVNANNPVYLRFDKNEISGYNTPLYLQAHSTLPVVVNSDLEVDDDLDVDGIIKAGSSNVALTSSGGGLKMAELANEDFSKTTKGMISFMVGDSSTSCNDVCDDHHGLVCDTTLEFGTTGFNPEVDWGYCNSTSSNVYRMCFCK